MTNTQPMPVRRIIRNISILDLVHYRLPVSGVLSILHRISGALMFVLLPLCLWLFDLSVRSEPSYQRLRHFAGAWFARLVLAALAWALVHHLLAGIRYLLLDLDLGVDRASARRSAWIVFALSVPLATWFALMIFRVL
jgi:succinate dehydrogenase / fumarate reductase cytochrome b subunit